LAGLGLLDDPALSEGVVERVVPDFPDPERHGPAKVGDGPPVGLSADLVGDLRAASTVRVRRAAVSASVSRRA
jgi:hypothetical protein